MIDVRTIPAFWGLCGALAWSATMLILAFYDPTATAAARSRAVAELVLGLFVGPIAAEVFSGAVLFWVPRLDFRAVALTLGLIAVPFLPKYAKWAQDKLFSKLEDKP